MHNVKLRYTSALPITDCLIYTQMTKASDIMELSNNYPKSIMQKLLDWDVYVGLVLSLVSMVVTFLLPIRDFVLLALLLIFIDHIMGVKVSKRDGRNITADGLQRTVTKGLLYFCFLLASHAITTVLHVPYIPYFAALMISRVEFKSIDGHMLKLTNVSIWDAVEKLFTFKNLFKK